MKSKISLLLTLSFLISSCTVTNNLYVSDPVPVGKSNFNLYGGLGSGLTPKIDSTSTNGDIHFSNGLELAPNLYFAGLYGLGEHTNLMFNVHLPYIVAGVGFHTGLQYCFFKNDGIFNAALGTDLGFVFAKDTLDIGISKIELSPDSKGAFNADIFLPLSIRLNDKSRIILTPRLSFYSFYVKKNKSDTNHDKSQKYQPLYPSISLGARLNKIHIEATAQYIEKQVIPGFGIVYIWPIDNKTKE